MAKPRFTNVHCSVCGRIVGKRPGTQVVQGIVCDNPICNFQEPASLNQARDAAIVAGILSGIPASQIAHASDMSRQRVYQIFTTWRSGV